MNGPKKFIIYKVGFKDCFSLMPHPSDVFSPFWMKSSMLSASTFLLSAITVGQIETDGNGIDDNDAGLSVNSNLIGFLCQSITISRIDDPQKYIESVTATIQNNLWKYNNWVWAVKLKMAI